MVLRTLVGEYYARRATFAWFSDDEPEARRLLRLALSIGPMSVRGMWLAAHAACVDGDLRRAEGLLRRYYREVGRRRRWSVVLQSAMRVATLMPGRLPRRVTPLVDGLSSSWASVRFPPRQVVSRLDAGAAQRLRAAHVAADPGGPTGLGLPEQLRELALQIVTQGASSTRGPLGPAVECQIRRSVDDRPWHIITEDHELSWSPGKGEASLKVGVWQAYVQLVGKGRVINEIARSAGTPWTHMIDVGAYWLLQLAGYLHPSSWGVVLGEFEDFLRETLWMGHDIGLHVHTEKSPLALGSLSSEVARFRAGPRWADLPVAGGGPGGPDRRTILAAGKAWIEAAVATVAPAFRVMAFRPGAYFMGETPEGAAQSYACAASLGIPVFSEALEFDGITESLGRSTQPAYRFDPGQAWCPVSSGALLQLLPLRMSGMPVYSVLRAARLHARGDGVLGRLEASAAVAGLALSIDHEIDIGSSRHGGSWSELDPSRGEWPVLSRYLHDLQGRGSFACVRLRDAVT